MFYKMRSWVFRVIARLERHADRPWYTFAVTFLAAIDLFVAIIPIDGLLISSVLLKPKRWVSLAILMSGGSALGAFVLGLLIQIYGEPFAHAFFHDQLSSPAWQSLSLFLGSHGALALTLIAASPLPQQLPVIVCALAHLPLPLIFISVFIGRTLKYLLFAWSSQHAPRLLHWWRTAEKEKEAIEMETKK